MHCLLMTLVFGRPACGQETVSEQKNSQNYLMEFPPEVTGVTGNPVPAGTVTVTVKNLSTLLTMADGDVSRIILHVDGHPLKGIEPRRSSEPDDLRYDLKRTSESDRAWAALLGRPKLRPRKVSISVGLENQPVPTQVSGPAAHDLNVLGGTSRFMVLVGLFLLGLCLSLYLATRSTLLRKPVGDSIPVRMKRFSLARSQMALWFFIVPFSYLFLWMLSGDRPQITPGVLLVLLISSSTCLGATFIDSRERLINRRLATYLPNKEITSLGFVTDILSDREGLSFSRLQLVIWTLLLLMVFLSTMYNIFAIPNLDVTLLLLMCIGCVTYLGFKVIHLSELGSGHMTDS
jgi:hypothetical protein